MTTPVPWQPDALAHAQEAFPREACGLVLVDGRYIRCRNVAIGEDHFDMPAADYAAAEDLGEIAAIFHSHPNAGCNPSDADRTACEASGLPWHIVALPSGQWGGCVPCGWQAPLIGRPFAHGVLDCYTLIRDWYRIERGIVLPDFHRSDEWWRRGGNLYTENFAAAGFRAVRIDQARIGDVVLMQVLSNVANHAAILVESGVILHHLHGQVSRREVYGHYYRKHTTHFLRHRDCDAGFAGETGDPS